MPWCLTTSPRTQSLPFSSWPSTPDAYELRQRIGDGSSAAVYEAKCKGLPATVAVKRLDLDGHADIAALIREAALLRRFQHPHVMTLHTSFVVGRELWMVMPLMDLGSLRTVLRRAFPQGMEESVIATTMKSTLQALHYVHKNGGIHRDIKADNILVNSRGEVRLADFGVASDHRHSHTLSVVLDRVLSNSAQGPAGGLALAPSSGSSSFSCSHQGSSTAGIQSALMALRANTFVGTPCWMAPEVMQQEEGYDETADIWSFGITLIELATGKPPGARCNPMRVMLDTLNNPPPSLPPDTPERHFSKAFRELVASCLQKDPAKRPSAATLLQHRFFRAARDASFLANALRSVRSTAADVTGAVSAGRPGSITPAPDLARAGSAPMRQPESNSLRVRLNRKAHSEPLMVRLKSVLKWRLQANSGRPGSLTVRYLDAGLMSFIGYGSKSGSRTRALSSYTCGNGRQQSSRWQSAAAAIASFVA